MTELNRGKSGHQTVVKGNILAEGKQKWRIYSIAFTLLPVLGVTEKF